MKGLKNEIRKAIIVQLLGWVLSLIRANNENEAFLLAAIFKFLNAETPEELKNESKTR